ncbi:MAG: glycosyltransferase family 4 protein [Anaerolineae bacterium]
MHLAFNASDLGRQRGGNESYLLGLFAGLASIAEQASMRISLIVADKGRRLVRSDPRFQCLNVIDAGPYRRLPFLLWQQTAILSQLRPDWYISTFFLPPVTPCKAGVLIHDLSFRAHPEYFPPAVAFYMRLLTSLAVHRASLVIALSQFTRREIERFHPSAAGKMAVVYPGISPEFVADGDPAADDQVLAELGIHHPYLLAVGNVHPRKNLGRLLAAWEQLRDAGSRPPSMVWAGMGRWQSEPLLEQARAAGVHLPGFVPARHLPALYRRAKALAYPSLYEGFGLPPLEAMACGTPVLTSNNTALPEAVGNAAVTVDPTQVDALADGLARVLFDPHLRRALRGRGLDRARQFRWEQSAWQLLDALREGYQRGDP